MLKNNKKEQIIKKGMNVLKEKGYNGCGVAEIIKKANIPKGSFYYYFKSKEDFAVEVLKYYSEHLLSVVRDALLNQNESPKQRILNLYSDQVNNYNLKKTFPYGSFASMICQEVGEKHKPIFEVSNKLFLDLKKIHVDCLTEAIRKKEIKKNKNTEKLAELILYSWEGAVLRIKVNGNHDSLDVFMEMLTEYILN